MTGTDDRSDEASREDRELKDGNYRSLVGALLAVGLLAGVIFGTVALLVGSRLLTIDDLTAKTRDVIIPKTITQQKQAIATESLTKYASQVIHAASEDQRATIIDQAQSIAATMGENSEGQQRDVVENALTGIRQAATHAMASKALEAKIGKQLAHAEKIIREIDTNLASIAEDSSSGMEDQIEGISDLHGGELETLASDLRVLFRINGASQNLITNLRDIRAVLLVASSATRKEKTTSSAGRFNILIRQLRGLMETLPSTGDFEYFPDLIEQVAGLNNVFELKQDSLWEFQSAEQQSKAAIDTLTTLSKDLSFDAASNARRSVEEIALSTRTIEIVAFAALVVLSLFVFIVGWLVRREVIRPIVTASTVLDELSAGNTKINVPSARFKELRAIRRSIGSFRDTLVNLKRLDAEKAEQEQRTQEEKKHTMASLADGFEASIKSVIDSMGSAAAEMESSAQSMSSTAEETNQQSAAVASAAEQASVNVQSVSAATDELTASLEEVSRMVTMSTNIARNAVIEAEKSSASMKDLSEAAQKIGDVVDLITKTAEQTNLLALNATIEAARAGDAGKGFAVVASEVKGLANQTAKATEQIAAQIAAIQGATGDSVQAIEGVSKVIHELDEIAASIAGAVEEQNASTQEIARNTQQAAKGTGEVSENMEGIAKAAGETGAASGQVLNSAQGLTKQSTELSAKVDDFLESIRGAA